MMTGSPYQSYVYAYPHKTAYRRLRPAQLLADLWAAEPRDALFLYVHIPFCRMRCGFCNLFTVANAEGGVAARYLAALERQMAAVSAALGEATVATMAIGGGTPTYLDAAELDALFERLRAHFGVGAVAISVETSPQTATPDRLAALRAQGVTRLSMGIQSFDASETRAVGRPQRAGQVETALAYIAAAGFPTVNLDLIYGIPGQTVDSWLASLARAHAYAPQELYLYPLYVRPLTGLDGCTAPKADERLRLYRAGRDWLLERGYVQVSMRFFRAPHAPARDGLQYDCQQDGMVGLGCGARSYTRGLHYSSEYAVGRPGVLGILMDYIAQPAGAFTHAVHGFRLGADEQRRRYILKSILRAEGLDRAAYAAYFASEALTDYPMLYELVERGYMRLTPERLSPTARGLEWSDAIGPWLYSPAVRALMEGCDLA